MLVLVFILDCYCRQRFPLSSYLPVCISVQLRISSSCPQAIPSQDIEVTLRRVQDENIQYVDIKKKKKKRHPS